MKSKQLFYNAALRTLMTSLSMAVVAAVVEVLVRFAHAKETILAPQLALAAFTNVAGLGLMATGLVLVAWTAVWCYALVRPKFRLTKAMAISPWLIGVVLAVLLLETELLGFGSNHFSTAPIAFFTAGVSAVVGFRRSRRSKKRPYLTRSTQVGVVLAWLVCTSLAIASTGVTRDGIDHWLQNSTPIHEFQSEPAPNIVLVVLDTLRADRVGVYGGGDLTPNLDRLARSSIVYTQAHSTAPWTLPAHASLFTGLYPDQHGVNWGHYRLDNRAEVMAELLKDQGYDTFAVSNNWLLNEENGFARGFDSFIETSTDPILNRWRMALKCGVVKSLIGWMGLSTEAGSDAGSAWTNWMMRKQFTRRSGSHKPFFAFINYFEPHDPYDPPDRFLKKYLTEQQRQLYTQMFQSEEKLAAHACGLPGVFSREQIRLMSSLYDAEVAYQDEMVGELVHGLEETGLLDRSWLIITSDHGELFGENGMVYHTAGSHDKLLHIPLIVRPPGGIQGWRSDAPVQPVDVFVTLLQQAGASVPAAVRRAYPLPLTPEDSVHRHISIAQTHGASIAGLSIAQRLNMQADFSRWMTWVTSIYADGYLLELDSNGPRALFDLNRDPEMKENVIEKKPDIKKSMMRQYDRWVEQGSKSGET